MKSVSEDETTKLPNSGPANSTNSMPMENVPPLNVIMNCPPPLPGQYFPSYPFIPPLCPSVFSHTGRPPLNCFPSINVPPPNFGLSQCVTPLHKNVNDGSHGLSSDLIFKDEPKEEMLFPNVVKKTNIVSSIKLCEVSKQFRMCYQLLKELTNELSSISNENPEADSEKWKQTCKRITNKQKKFLSYKNSMNLDSEFLSALKYKIKLRQKKRKYRNRIKHSKSSIQVHEIASMHAQQLQQDAHNVKQEEKLKREADNILSSVIQKKADARYQIQLLTNLLKLHSARVHQLTIETKFTPDQSVSGFEKVLEKLKNLWESKLQEYCTEENGLKLMIRELAINAEDEDCMKLKAIFEKWLQLLFGTSNLQSEQFYFNYDQLVNIRRGWDKYTVEDGTGSKIPAGWVVPKYNENESWRKYLFE